MSAPLDNDDDNNNVSEELIECNRLPLLRMKAVQGTEGALSLARVNGARSDDDDNKGRLEMISSRNKDLNSTKKNLFVQEF